MDAPAEFTKVCRNLVQGLEISSAQELVQIALLDIGPQERPAIKAFLDELLSGRHSDDQLRDIWWSMPSDVVFYDGKDVATFLKMLRHELDKTA